MGSSYLGKGFLLTGKGRSICSDRGGAHFVLSKMEGWGVATTQKGGGKIYIHSKKRKNPKRRGGIEGGCAGLGEKKKEEPIARMVLSAQGGAADKKERREKSAKA